MSAHNVTIVAALAGFLTDLTDTQRAIVALLAAGAVGLSIGLGITNFRDLPERVKAAEVAVETNTAAIHQLQANWDVVIEGQQQLCRVILERENFTQTQIAQACRR